MVNDKIEDEDQMYLLHWLFWWPCGRVGARLLIFPDAACPELHRKPLDAPLGNYLLRIAPAAARVTGKQTTINKYT
jgi:hypothetical protein